MLRRPRCHTASFVSGAALSATFSERWGTGGGDKDLRDFFFLRASEKPEHAQGGKRAESSPLQEQQLIWWARKQRVRATYCRCTARLLLCHSGLRRRLCRWRRAGATRWTLRHRDGPERERAARRDGRAQPRHGRFSWKYQESKANVNTLREEVGKPEDLDYTAASSFALTEKSWLQIRKKEKKCLPGNRPCIRALLLPV